MGDRISLQFKNGDTLSVVLYAHWAGTSLFEAAQEYATQLKREIKEGQIAGGSPLARREPDVVMVDFIVRTIAPCFEGNGVEASWRLWNSDLTNEDDNGHVVIEL